MSVVFIVLVLGAVAFVVIGVLSLLQKLPRNAIVGIRTPFTLESDRNWYATHRAGAPWMIFGGVAVMMASIAFLPFALIGKLSDAAALTIIIILTVLLLVSAIGAWLFGTWGARHDVLGTGFPKE